VWIINGIAKALGWIARAWMAAWLSFVGVMMVASAVLTSPSGLTSGGHVENWVARLALAGIGLAVLALAYAVSPMRRSPLIEVRKRRPLTPDEREIVHKRLAEIRRLLDTGSAFRNPPALSRAVSKAIAFLTAKPTPGRKESTTQPTHVPRRSSVQRASWWS
jgi:hypothetical protein